MMFTSMHSWLKAPGNAQEDRGSAEVMPGQPGRPDERDLPDHRPGSRRIGGDGYSRHMTGSPPTRLRCLLVLDVLHALLEQVNNVRIVHAVIDLLARLVRAYQAQLAQAAHVMRDSGFANADGP